MTLSLHYNKMAEEWSKNCAFRLASLDDQGQRFCARQVSNTFRLQLTAASEQSATQLARFGSMLNSRARHSATQSARCDSHGAALTQTAQSTVWAVAMPTSVLAAIRHARLNIARPSETDAARDGKPNASRSRPGVRNSQITAGHRSSLLPEVPRPGQCRRTRCGLQGPG
jgi:hypothetical protein